MRLNRQRLLARDILVKVAKGTARTKRLGFISYKELWSRLSTRNWGRAHVREIVEIITDVSAHELLSGRPPLNELVVPATKSTPTEPWEGIRHYLKKKSGKIAPYASHTAAQEACWTYWRRGDAADTQTEDEAEEGRQGDQTTKFRKRNHALIQVRKEKDGHKCQACRFRLRVGKRYVIDCHHKYPLANGEGVRATRLSDLICLCPTCHRVAHTKKHPLDVEEIRKTRGI